MIETIEIINNAIYAIIMSSLGILLAGGILSLLNFFAYNLKEVRHEQENDKNIGYLHDVHFPFRHDGLSISW